LYILNSGTNLPDAERFLLNEKAPTPKNRGQQLNDKIFLHSAKMVFLSKPVTAIIRKQIAHHTQATVVLKEAYSVILFIYSVINLI
jgi:hypothetical protein